MKCTRPMLFLASLFLACQPTAKQQPPTGPTAIDTVVVDDDTLENRADNPAIDSAIVAVATVPGIDSTSISPADFYIIPGKRVGMITPTATEATLIQLAGKINVTREAIPLGEGDSEPGTTLFKGTANEVHILWKDKKRFANPDAIIIQPAPNEAQAATVTPSWLVDNGLKIGSTLKEVEQINGKPFKLYGFGWDMGGAFSDAQGGKFQSADGKTYLSITFGPGKITPAQEKLLDTVSGDSEFLSSLPAMQKLNPAVETIQVRFK